MYKGKKQLMFVYQGYRMFHIWPFLPDTLAIKVLVWVFMFLVLDLVQCRIIEKHRWHDFVATFKK